MKMVYIKSCYLGSVRRRYSRTVGLFFSLGLTLELHEELLDSTVTDEQLSPDAQRPAWLADGSSKAGFCRNRRFLEEESELQQVAPRRIHSGSCPARHGISVKEA
uniref:uncharacterized protein LOC106997229 n=1 Tax=Macaca mulatta TaxID=9544 RepID=UPI0010A29173|nr:uncharacterized protein LOC106997229 [Macaca mulatta]